MKKAAILFASWALLACSDASTSSDASSSGAADTAQAGSCVAGGTVPRTVALHGPDGAVVSADVTADQRCPDSAQLTVAIGGTSYDVRLTENRVEISVGGAAPKLVAVWKSSGGLTVTSETGATIGEPLRPYLLVTAADIAGFDPIALTVLDWGSLVAILELVGADPNGNDPAADAASLPGPLQYLQLHPPVLRMEINDLAPALSQAMVGAMDALMNDRDVVDFHHFGLCHVNEAFFIGHDSYMDTMEAHLKGVTPAIELPFGRMPWWKPGGPIPPAYAIWSAVADEFYADHDACSAYPKRVCADELMYTVKFSEPDIQDTYPCNPDNRATWCQGLLQGLPCSDLLATTPDDYLGCEDDDNDGLPDQCPYGLLNRFVGEAICDYADVGELWAEMIDWHGQVHERIGGAHGDHCMTATTPTFWLLHITLGTLYEGYLRCP